MVKLPTASLCRRRVYTDFPALRSGEKSFAEHEKQKPVQKTCSLWTISSQIIFGMRQNEGDTEETTENRLKGCIWRNQSAKESPKAVNTRTSSWEQKRHPCALKARIGNNRVGRFSHQRVYPKDGSHFCFIVTSQQELENNHDRINYDFFFLSQIMTGRWEE